VKAPRSDPRVFGGVAISRTSVRDALEDVLNLRHFLTGYEYTIGPHADVRGSLVRRSKDVGVGREGLL